MATDAGNAIARPNGGGRGEPSALGRFLRRTVHPVIVILLVTIGDVVADEPKSEPNLVSPTLGGTQWWGDELLFHGWRIQRHAETGHCRLLDEKDLRHAWGTFDECEARLKSLRRERSLPPMRRKVVLVLHGMFRSRNSLDKLCEVLAVDPQREVLPVSYPSTRASIAYHARALSSIVRGLEGVDEIDFVAFSLGNLVVRHYLGDQTDPRVGRKPDARIRRIVMICPPNNGALRAQEWAEKKVLGKLYRVALPELGEELADWDSLVDHLAVPTCEFGIIAGGRGDDEGWEDDLPGDDDGTLSVDETRLAGARDFLVLPEKHSAMLSDRRAAENALRFLQRGRFAE